MNKETKDNADVIRIKELDIDMIAPSTATYKDPEQGGTKTVICGKPGCFSIGTPVLMYDGSIKNVEDVCVGDSIMGPDSRPRNVLELCRNNDRMYKILPTKGDGYTVNKQHKLVLKSKTTIVEITVENFLKKSYNERKLWNIFRGQVEFPAKPVSVDSYMLGFLINFTYTSVDPPSSDNELICYIHENRLLSNKRIPDEYKINSREVRLDILAGIIDISGTYNDRYVLSISEKVFSDDIVYVARSLGFCVDRKDNFIYIGGDVGNIPCRIHKRPALTFQDSQVSDFDVIPQGFGDYYGFTIDGDHRFLLGSFDVVRNTGKTTLIASLLYAKKHIFPVAMAMSGTEDSNHFYRSVMPSTFVFNNYDETHIENFIRRQKIAKEHLENPWAIMILDDCTDDPALFRKPLQNGLYKRGRHWKMWYILSLQYGMDVRPVIRTNVDGVFILREPNLRNRRVMYENYAAIIPDFKLFCDILDQITNDYTALYIHNATKTNDWKECVFWYKAKPVPKDFKFGCDSYWDFHYSRYNPDYVDPVTI